MSVAKRKTTAGETAEYHYAFSHNGKRFRGVCENCTTQKQAEEYERKLIATEKGVTAQKNVRALVENYRDVLTGGSPISLLEAYELSLKKPKKRMPSEELIKIKRSYWQDFIAFMTSHYPDITTLANILPLHAEDYIHHLRLNGRFNKLVSYTGTKITRKREYHMKGELSPKTINTYQQVLCEVFQLLSRDAGLMENPFAAIPKLNRDETTREAFTESELKAIRDNSDDFIRPLFIIAVATALREGDICTLKWNEVDLRNEVIIKRMRKTGNVVEIPMMPPILQYLTELKEGASKKGAFSEYVLPMHAEMYLTNSSGVSYRIKQFLENKCGIITTKIPPNRSRAVSVKDLHSCRHTFCYYAGLFGIPLTVVQSIVGHMTPEMTKHYSAHTSREVKREKMKLLPSFLLLTEAKSIESGVKTDSTEMLASLIAKLETLPEERLIELNSMIDPIISSDQNQRNKIREILKIQTESK